MVNIQRVLTGVLPNALSLEISCYIVTLIRFISSVYFLVSYQMTIDGKTYATLIALIRFFFSVYSMVLYQIPFFVKIFVTLVALISFISSVYSLVFYQMILP